VSEVKEGSILIVDDDEIKRYTISRVLAKAGFTLSEASTGAEALEKAATNPDLIILDVQLPDVDGLEVCRRLKSDPTTSSIVVLHYSSIATESSDRVLGLDGGADGYITGSVSPPELIATVRSMLRIRTAERTARELARQWQASFDAIGDGVCLFDENDRIIRCNAAIEQFAGQSAASLVGKGCGSLAQGALLEPMCADARTTGARQSREFDVGGKWFRGVVDPVYYDTGGVTGSVYIVTDISAAKERELERAELLRREQEARTQAETANRMKDEFLATISHELRTPLNSMLGWLALMRNGKLDENGVARAIDTLERNARSQTQLIADILDVSRITTGKIRLDVATVDLVTVIEAALDSARPGADAKGVALVGKLDPGAGRTIGDGERLQQVAWNLLSNAIKFTPKGGIVEVTLTRVGSSAEIAVRDTGAGIDPEFLPFVFDRFQQADSSTTRSHTGLGLGLSIVRHLVELHGGSVRAESEGPGKGARFTVVLPIREVIDARERATLGPFEQGEADRSLDGVRILVVDDDEDSRQMISTLFEQSGAVVRMTGTAPEALEEIVTWRPDVLVSDIGLPGEDGHSLLRRVRALPPAQGGLVPAIALTAYANIETRLLALAAGFQVFMTKPVDPPEVIVAASRLVRARGGE